MRAAHIFIFLFFTSYVAVSQPLYSKAFGLRTNNPVIFLHGGPSSSSVYFEATAAQKLANQGFYVIIYDRRGEGRSVNKHAKMNYDEAFRDLNGIYKKYKLTQANLIGFSFGGLVTSLYAQKYPKKVKSIILVSSLLSQQASYNTILNTTETI
jgi:proline iminopeptidase